MAAPIQELLMLVSAREAERRPKTKRSSALGWSGGDIKATLSSKAALSTGWLICTVAIECAGFGVRCRVWDSIPHWLEL